LSLPEDLKPEQFIAGSYTISLDVAGRRITMGGYVRETDDKASIIAKMNRDQECIDHQLIKADLKSQEGHLKGDLAQLEALLDDHEQLVAKQGDLKPGGRLHAQDQAKMRNFEPSKDHLKASIAMRKKIIEENRKTLDAVLGSNGEALSQ